MKEAVDDMMVTLNEAASEVGMVGGMVESIAEAMAKVSPGCRVWYLATNSHILVPENLSCPFFHRGSSMASVLFGASFFLFSCPDKEPVHTVT